MLQEPLWGTCHHPWQQRLGQVLDRRFDGHVEFLAYPFAVSLHTGGEPLKADVERLAPALADELAMAQHGGEEVLVDLLALALDRGFRVADHHRAALLHQRLPRLWVGIWNLDCQRVLALQKTEAVSQSRLQGVVTADQQIVGHPNPALGQLVARDLKVHVLKLAAVDPLDPSQVEGLGRQTFQVLQASLKQFGGGRHRADFGLADQRRGRSSLAFCRTGLQHTVQRVGHAQADGVRLVGAVGPCFDQQRCRRIDRDLVVANQHAKPEARLIPNGQHLGRRQRMQRLEALDRAVPQAIDLRIRIDDHGQGRGMCSLYHGAHGRHDFVGDAGCDVDQALHAAADGLYQRGLVDDGERGQSSTPPWRLGDACIARRSAT